MSPSTIQPFPVGGTPVDEVVRDLDARRGGDVRWAEGRTFGLVFDGGPEVRQVAEEAARLFLHENALNTTAFPSLGEIQTELCPWTADLLHGPPEAAGFLTSGGHPGLVRGAGLKVGGVSILVGGIFLRREEIFLRERNISVGLCCNGCITAA